MVRNITYVCMLIFLSSARSAIAQSSSSTADIPSQSLPQVIFDFIVNVFSNGVSATNLTVAAVLLTISVFGLDGIFSFIRRVSKYAASNNHKEFKASRLFDVHTDKILGHELMVVGAQGAGKSSVIEMLSNGAVGRPAQETVGFRPFSFVAYHGIGDNVGDKSLLISGADFQGQNFGTLISGHTKITKPKGATALVVVVDVSPSPPKPDMKRTIIENVDYERINLHSDRLSASTIEAISGLMDDKKLKLVILFINAIDTVRKYRRDFSAGELSASHKEEIRELFSEIEGRLQHFGGGIQYRVVVGSAHSGDTRREFLSHLEEHAVIGGAG